MEFQKKIEDIENARKTDIKILNNTNQRAYKLERSLFIAETEIKNISWWIKFFIFIHTAEIFFITYTFFKIIKRGF